MTHPAQILALTYEREPRTLAKIAEGRGDTEAVAIMEKFLWMRDVRRGRWWKG